MEKNLTSGSILKNILYFSLPYLLSYFLQTLYGMADLFIIGQFEGVASTTAVSVGSQTMHMVTVVIVGLAMGSTVVIGQAIGANDREQASETIGNTITLFMSVAVLLMAGLLFCVKPIVFAMSTPEEAVQGTISYLTICFIGIPFVTAYNIISAVFRGLGDSKSPMYFIAVACVINIALDYLFMGVCQLGPVGAALGTTLSQTSSVIIAFLVIRKRKTGITLRKTNLKPKRAAMGKIVKIGIPVALQDGCIQISFMVITVIANRRGLSAAAAVGIVEKIISFIFLVPSSMLSAVSALGAQNIGAGKDERAKKTLQYAIIIAFTFGVFATIMVQFTADSLVSCFSSDKQVILYGGQYLRGYILDCMFAGIHFCFSGYFCACGKSGISFLHNMFSIVLLRVPGAYLASVMFPDTLFPMGLASTAGSILSVGICVIAFVWLQRQKKDIVREQSL